MSSKPASVPTWATTATGITRTTDPGGTVRGDGWNVGDRPPSGWWNYMWHQAGLWFQYLSDQVFTGDVSCVSGSFVTEQSDVAHLTRTYVVNPAAFTVSQTFIANARASFGEMTCDASVFSEFDVPLQLQSGQRLIAARVIARTEHGVASDINARLYKAAASATAPDSSGTLTEVIGATNLTGAGTEVKAITLTPGSPIATKLSDGNLVIGVRINVANTASPKHIYRVEFDVDRLP